MLGPSFPPETRHSHNGGPMSWIIHNIHRIMIVSGVLTLTTIYAAIAPEAALRSTFGASMEAPSLTLRRTTVAWPLRLHLSTQGFTRCRNERIALSSASG